MRVPRGLLTPYSLLLTTYYLLLTPGSLLCRCVCRAADAERVAALALELATGGKRGTKGGKALWPHLLSSSRYYGAATRVTTSS